MEKWGIGIFARVLVDVDLSESMFKSVVVEREDHALSISIQYEKHPIFCANCKMIGHSIQTCSKLGVLATTNKPSHTGTARAKPFKHVFKPVTVSSNQARKDVQTYEHVEDIEVNKVTTSEIEEGELPKHNTEKELGNVQKAGNNLILQNTFELLELDNEQGLGDATPKDKEYTFTNMDEQRVKNPTVEDISKKLPHTNMDKQKDKNPSVKEISLGKK